MSRPAPATSPARAAERGAERDRRRLLRDDARVCARPTASGGRVRRRATRHAAAVRGRDRSTPSSATFVILHLGSPSERSPRPRACSTPGGRARVQRVGRAVASARRGSASLFEAFADAEVRIRRPSVPAGPAFFKFADDAEFASCCEDAGFDRRRRSTHSSSSTLALADGDELWDGARRRVRCACGR